MLRLFLASSLVSFEWSQHTVGKTQVLRVIIVRWVKDHKPTDSGVSRGGTNTGVVAEYRGRDK